MKYDDVMRHFCSESQIGLSQALKKIGFVIGQSSISDWKLKGIPETTQFKLEVLTNGGLKADRPAVNLAPPSHECL